MFDNLLQQRVVDALAADPGIDASDIVVTVRDGVVRLSGSVPNLAQRMAAAQITGGISGTRGLTVDLDVHLPESARVEDAELASRARSAIAWNVSVPESAVTVEVLDGHVTLSGELKWHFQRYAAEAQVQMLRGVSKVTNSIRLQASGETQEMLANIRAALRSSRDADADRVRIEVKEGGCVTIEGEVGDWLERQAVESIVRAVPGVRLVDDRLRVEA